MSRVEVISSRGARERAPFLKLGLPPPSRVLTWDQGAWLNGSTETWTRMWAQAPSRYTENPSLYPGLPLFFIPKLGAKKSSKPATLVSPAHPCGDGVGVLLMRIACLNWEAPAPERWIDLDNGWSPNGNFPPVKGPKVDPVTDMPADVAKPRQARMGRFGDRTLNIKVKDRFRTACADFGEAPPASAPGP